MNYDIRAALWGSIDIHGVIKLGLCNLEEELVFPLWRGELGIGPERTLIGSEGADADTFARSDVTFGTELTRFVWREISSKRRRGRRICGTTGGKVLCIYRIDCGYIVLHCWHKNHATTRRQL